MGNHKVIKGSGSQTVRYSMYDFIEHVHGQPVLWNRQHHYAHSRERREEAWHNVARRLCENFDSIKEAEKQNIVQTLTKRWKNTRDSYLRACRLSQAEGARPYIYEKELDFLQQALKAEGATQESSPKKKTGRKRKSKAAPLHATRAQLKKRRSKSIDSNFSLNSDIERVCSEIGEQLENESIEETDIYVPVEQVSKKVEQTPRKAEQRAPNVTTEEAVQPKAEEANTQQYTPLRIVSSSSIHCAEAEADPDQNFFDSIKPVIRTMSVDQKLDFQIEVLKLLKNFRSN